MAFRNFNFATNVNAASSFQTSGILLEQNRGFSIQAVFSGSPVGTVKLQVSNDLGGDTPVVNWNDVASSNFAVSGAGVFDWNVSPFHFRWISVAYVSTSGTGSCTCVFNRNADETL